MIGREDGGVMAIAYTFVEVGKGNRDGSDMG